jgi:hypothetical protein
MCLHLVSIDHVIWGVKSWYSKFIIVGYKNLFQFRNLVNNVFASR